MFNKSTLHITGYICNKLLTSYLCVTLSAILKSSAEGKHNFFSLFNWLVFAHNCVTGKILFRYKFRTLTIKTISRKILLLRHLLNIILYGITHFSIENNIFTSVNPCISTLYTIITWFGFSDKIVWYLIQTFWTSWAKQQLISFWLIPKFFILPSMCNCSMETRQADLLCISYSCVTTVSAIFIANSGRWICSLFTRTDMCQISDWRTRFLHRILHSDVQECKRFWNQQFAVGIWKSAVPKEE